jgi:hypothetical protein
MRRESSGGAANKSFRFATKAFEVLRHMVENAGRLIVKDESSASRRWCTLPTDPATATFSDEWDHRE